MYPLKGIISPIFVPIISIGLPFLVFIFYKRKIKKVGFAKLYGDILELRLSDCREKIDFRDIDYYYYYQNSHGTTFTLHLKDQSKINVTCNNNFCKTKPFDDFLLDFIDSIVVFNKTSNFKITKLKTVFARKYIPYILIPSTLILLPLLFYIQFPGKILIIGLITGLIIPWKKYIDSKFKK
jgi:hypothetical protein